MELQKRIKLLSGTIAILTLILVGLGGFVRATGAGLACPDWPLCYGRAVPESFGSGIAQEVGHRYLASIVSLLTFILSYFVYRSKSELPVLWGGLKLLLVLLLVQVIFGGLTVTMKLNPFIVTTHLALGSIFLQSVALIAFGYGYTAQNPNSNFSKLGLFLSLVVFLQILLGGFVGSSGAALACIDIPLCSGSEFLPSNPSGAQLIQMLHRLFGVLIFVVIIALHLRSKGGKLYRNLSILLLLQVSLGFLNVYYQIPVFITVSHLILAQIILFLLLRSVFICSQNE